MNRLIPTLRSAALLTKLPFSVPSLAMSTTAGPITTAIRDKISAACAPTHLEILDDSSKHAGHAAMKGLNAVETHFRVTIVSEAFKGKTLIQRHRMIYDMLGDELRAGLHALQLKTKTPEEYEKDQQK
ncbi:bola-like protein-domain-containing protein [Catenaria anguillulae PL171]|uniref:Bola-like protein-domain-containing protein n=1 Tax=Catenaria anguillulae PL171 TaxID=765915 RepID=A0A1Y2HTD1_9FUNG|nr:bola-like protein-domain-containing protein [Catenaria anguillulae PL171]